MAFFSSIVAGIALAGTAVSAYSGYKEQKKAAAAQQQMAAAQRESIAAQQRASNVEAARQRMQMAREARIRKSQVLATAGLTGLGAGTAGVSGAVSSIGTQLAANIGTANVLTGFAEQASQANQRAADFSSKAATHMAKAQQWQQLGAISGSIFDRTGGYTTIFGGNTIPKKP